MVCERMAEALNVSFESKEWQKWVRQTIADFTENFDDEEPSRFV